MSAKTAVLEKTQDKSIFQFGGSFECFGDGDEDKQNIRLKLYDGGIHAHWYWGNLAFDLKTMKLAKRRAPILIDHDTSQRAGVGNKAVKDGGFVLEGQFLKTSEAAQEVRLQAIEGYPFEASLRFDPSRAKIVQVGEGDTHEINGRTLKGPGTAIYNTVIMEGSIVTFGALAGCATEVFDESKQEGSNMTETSEMTLDTFRAEHTELHSKVFSMGKAEGEKNERDLFAAIAKACPDAELASKCYIEGKSALEAATAYGEKVGKENADLKVKLAKTPTAPAKVDPDAAANAEFIASDQSDAHDKSEQSAQPETEDALRKEFAASADLQKEFGEDGADNYVAFKKAEKAGQVRILKQDK